jgi:hypothetical protein
VEYLDLRRTNRQEDGEAYMEEGSVALGNFNKPAIPQAQLTASCK